MNDQKKHNFKGKSRTSNLMFVIMVCELPRPPDVSNTLMLGIMVSGTRVPSSDRKLDKASTPVWPAPH